ncbi:ATP phosphoribosyltransferase [Litorivicinus lipolyticus]|uniref:ATP phosphoribosyltransferase n=1 Tax=Litorivicinus lipolyticus TaxID=418701 RepID=A0A5Q2QF31_9GAMM|nr:ATP phosphoribosyltransferase [Litorivicinus lipolyticus]QGG80971.1 ATP phosphoribosyltransferase [Litorivicinus lipolyticus]
MNPLIIALSKGRLLTQTLPLLKAAGIEPAEDLSDSRKLIFDTTRDDVKFIVLRAVDVPTFVARGAAHLGVSGLDQIAEQNLDDLYLPLDLKVSVCRLMTAGVVGAPLPLGRRRVATKYLHLAREYYARTGVQVELIKLYGAMELAPLVGLADEIVDIVDTGNTLKANGLEPRQLIMHSSARLVANKAAWKTRFEQLKPLVDQMEAALV